MVGGLLMRILITRQVLNSEETVYIVYEVNVLSWLSSFWEHAEMNLFANSLDSIFKLLQRNWSIRRKRGHIGFSHLETLAPIILEKCGDTKAFRQCGNASNRWAFGFSRPDILGEKRRQLIFSLIFFWRVLVILEINSQLQKLIHVISVHFHWRLIWLIFR